MDSERPQEEYYIPLDYAVARDCTEMALVEELDKPTDEDEQFHYTDLSNATPDENVEEYSDVQFDPTSLSEDSFQYDFAPNSNFTYYNNVFNQIPHAATSSHAANSSFELSTNVLRQIPHFPTEATAEIRPSLSSFNAEFAALETIQGQPHQFACPPLSWPPRAPFRAGRERGRPRGSRGRNAHSSGLKGPNRDDSMHWLLNFSVKEILENRTERVESESYWPSETTKVVTKKTSKKVPYHLLIEKALEDQNCLTVNGIYDWLRMRYPNLEAGNDETKKLSIQNSIRHSLSVGHRFEKMTRVRGSYLWRLNQENSDSPNIEKTSKMVRNEEESEFIDYQTVNDREMKRELKLRNEEELDRAIRSISNEAQMFYDRETQVETRPKFPGESEKVNRLYSYLNWEPCMYTSNEMESV